MQRLGSIDCFGSEATLAQWKFLSWTSVKGNWRSFHLSNLVIGWNIWLTQTAYRGKWWVLPTWPRWRQSWVSSGAGKRLSGLTQRFLNLLQLMAFLWTSASHSCRTQMRDAATSICPSLFWAAMEQLAEEAGHGWPKGNTKRHCAGMQWVWTWLVPPGQRISFFARLQKNVIQEPGALDKILEVYSDDVLYKLMTEGLQSADGQRWWFIHLATKADLPALQKLTNSYRSFGNVPRAASSRNPCKGICYLCSAGQEADPVAGLPAIPYEDVSRNADWVRTTAQQVPWNTLPTILTHLPLSTEEKIRFFRTDLWHNARLGVLKQFTACAFVAIVESGLGCLPAGSIEAKFSWLTGLYRQHFRTPPFVSEISRDTMCFPASTASPIGKWSKGAASAEMMSFLDAFCRDYIVGHTEDRLLLSIVARHVITVFLGKWWSFGIRICYPDLFCVLYLG